MNRGAVLVAAGAVIAAAAYYLSSPTSAEAALPPDMTSSGPDPFASSSDPVDGFTFDVGALDPAGATSSPPTTTAALDPFPSFSFPSLTGILGGIMSPRPDYTSFIEKHEGRRARAYRDSRGILTVGVGFNLQRDDARARLAALGVSYDAVASGQLALTDAQIDMLRDGDIANAIATGRSTLADFDGLPSDVRLVVVDMAFNLGAGGFRGFRNFIAALDARDFARAADEMTNSLWFSQVGSRAVEDRGLVRAFA